MRRTEDGRMGWDDGIGWMGRDDGDLRLLGDGLTTCPRGGGGTRRGTRRDGVLGWSAHADQPGRHLDHQDDCPLT